MFSKTSILVIIGIIFFVLVLYYFYDDICNVKKTLIPTYQKVMKLETQVAELEKKLADPGVKRNGLVKDQGESPAFSITYQSDLIGPACGQSIRYTSAINDSEIAEIRRKNIVKPVTVSNSSNKVKIVSPIAASVVSPVLFTSAARSSPTKVKSPTKISPQEYKKMYDQLSSEALTAGSDDQFDLISSPQIDLDMAKNISDSVKFAEIEKSTMSELSDIQIDNSCVSEVSDLVYNKIKLKKVNRTLSQRRNKKT